MYTSWQPWCQGPCSLQLPCSASQDHWYWSHTGPGIPTGFSARRDLSVRPLLVSTAVPSLPAPVLPTNVTTFYFELFPVVSNTSDHCAFRIVNMCPAQLASAISHHPASSSFVLISQLPTLTEHWSCLRVSPGEHKTLQSGEPLGSVSGGWRGCWWDPEKPSQVSIP